jgi:hypothetical protein
MDDLTKRTSVVVVVSRQYPLGYDYKNGKQEALLLLPLKIQLLWRLDVAFKCKDLMEGEFHWIR